MEKLESQEYRDQLAAKIKNVKSNEGPDRARELLIGSERESVVYKVSELLHRLKNVLPTEYEDYLEKFIHIEDSQEVLENFEIIDISSFLKLEHRLFVEAEILEQFAYHKYKHDVPSEIKTYFKEITTLLFPQSDTGGFGWGIDSGPDLFNEITEGRFFDNRNLNHVVNAQRNVREFLIEPFHFESQIKTEGSRGNKSFFLCAGYNPYTQQISKPLVIFNPKDMRARKFVEEGYEFYGEKIADHVRSKGNNAHLIKDKEGNVGYCVGGGDKMKDRKSPLYRLLFLAAYPIFPDHGYEELVFSFDKTGNKDTTEYTWSDISSEMVNLHTGKRYIGRQKLEDDLKVDESIQFYRKLLRDKFGIDFEIDKDKEIKDLEK